ncbi:hypothetical protein [Candidatus Methylocalor cossyra]|uniref:Uncharacterized protein n=1 Tax=Candidatus Methylocalor cossyra TaxID=3108543 RepID=A0ABM9NJE5_9GAMM
MKRFDLILGVAAGLMAAGPGAGADERYPAADFTPQVLTQNQALIAQHQAAAAQRAQAERAEAVAGAGEGGGVLKENAPLAVAVLALGGLVFWRTRQRPAPGEPPPVAVPAPPAGETRVARYLQRLGAAPGGETRVAQYLRRLEATPAGGETRVARYLKNRDAGR